MNFFHRITLRVVTAVAALLFIGAGVANAQWADGPNIPPANDRWSFSTSYYDGKIYAFGGVGGNALLNSTSILDVSSGATNWQNGPLMAQGIYRHTSAVLNDRIYIVGGQTSGTQYSIAVNSYDPANGSFRAETALPRASAQAASVSIDGKIFVIGGVTISNNRAVFTNSTLVFDGTSWTDIPNSAPYSGYDQMATVIGNTVYIAGGQGQAGLAAYKGTVNGNNIAWTRIADIPVVIAGGGMSAVDGKPMIAGGISSEPGYRGAWILNEATNKWDPYYSTARTLAYSSFDGDGTTPYLMGGQGSNATLKVEQKRELAIAEVNQNAVYMSVRSGSQTSMTIPVFNAGIINLDVTSTVPGDATWLTVPNASVPGGTSSSVSFRANASELDEGTYSTTVTLATNDANNANIDVNVYLYVGDPGIEQESKLVLEEGSGDWCGWCPNGHDKIKEGKAVYGDRLIVLSYHGGSTTEPLMISEGVNILSRLGLGGYPNAALNRTTLGGNSGPMVGVSTQGNAWKDLMDLYAQAQPKALADMTVENYNFNPETREVTADVTLKVGQWVNPDQLYLTAVVTQEGIYTRQVDYVSGDHDSYEQLDAVRHVWPNATGSKVTVPQDQLAFNFAPPGATVTTQVRFTVPNMTGLGNFEIKPEDSYVTFLAHVNQGTTLGPVLQAHQTAMMSGPAGPAISVEFPTTKTKSINSGETAEFKIGVTNNTSEAIEITINRAMNDLPSGWISEICTGPIDCDDAGTVSFSIPANGQHDFTLKVNGTSADGQGMVRLVFNGGEVSEDATFTVNTAVSSVAVPGEVEGLSMTSITPNPAATVTQVNVTVPNGAETTLEVFSVTGQKVATLFEGRLEAGLRQIEADVTALQSGKYVLLLTSGDKKVSRTLTIVR